LYPAGRLTIRPERVDMGGGTGNVVAAGGVRQRLTAAATIPGRCRRRRSVVPKKTERGARYGDELYRHQA